MGDTLLSARARASRSSAIRDLLRLTEQPDVLSLAGGLPAAEALDVDRVRLAVAAVLERGPGPYGHAALQYGPTEGFEPLRAAIAARIGVAPAEVLVTTGSQQGLDLVARCLVDPGDEVVTTAPAYVGALAAFEAAGAAVVALPCDDDGFDTGALAARCRAGRVPKAAYVVPDFANPSGLTLSTAARAALAGLSQRYGFVIVADDPYGALRWRGARPDPVGTHGGVVVSLGSASKVLAPGLRVGWLTAPGWLLGPLVRAKQAADLHTSSLAQCVAAELLADGAWFSAHVARMRAMYAARCGALAGAVDDALGPFGWSCRPPDGGMFLWGRLPGHDTTTLLREAVGHGVAFVPGASFYPAGGGADRLRMSFSALREPDLREAAARLGRAVRAAPAVPA